MSFTFDDAKELVQAITGKSGNTRTVIAGVVMIAPIFCKSFKVGDIVNATGFKRNQVERAALNLWRYGIWGNDESWTCEWGRLFAGEPENIPDEEMRVIQMAFICDVLVAEGLVMREGEGRKDLRYKSLEVAN